MSRTSTYLATLVGEICILFFINLFFFAHSRTVRNDVVQGILIGYGLAFVTAQIYAHIKPRKVNGWIIMFGLGKPGNGILLRATHGYFEEVGFAAVDDILAFLADVDADKTR